ncbi:DUF6701 domain-containing protein [Gilvimarinus sp. DA14]|uniref:DUF6701 domain-containing protein n=1 Tax=Gilvimarinus sp. DA14 TaxID=2956798 RepID=UPI0020B6981E|nr:DUF6701 domain-containing protein [Gilvimarinus sp. DA14]UTF61389.1 PA14 domain-containing protein [Gilvimarinus sp. DA14]
MLLRGVTARWCLLGSLLLPSLAWAQACEDIFTSGVQSHSNNGTVTLRFRSEVNGGGSQIDTVNLNTANEVTCAGGTCQASGTPAATSSPSFVVGSGSEGNVNATGPVGNNTNVAAGDYRNINVRQERQLTFTTTDGLYLMESLSTNYRSSIRFRAGDYWIDGDLTVAQETSMEMLGSGTARIFVNGNVSFGFRAATSGFNPDQLLIYSTGNISLANEVEISGFLYAAGNVQANFRAAIQGAVSGASVTLDNETTINYPQGVLADADFAPFCSGGQPPAVLTGYWQMDEPQWTGAVDEVLDSSGNSLHGTPVSAMTDDATPALSGNPGTCGYGAFNGSTDYIRVPHDPLLNGLEGLSYSAWVRADTWTGVRQIMAKSVHGGGSGRAQMGLFSEGGSLKARVETDAGRYDVAATLPASGNWVHVASVFEGDELKLYVNGGQVGSTSFSRTQLIQTTDPLIIGKRVGTAQYFFQGDIDEVRVYQGALTADEVSALASERHECLLPLCPGDDEQITGGLLGEYYNSTNFSGGVVGARVDGPVDFDWASGNPGVNSVNANQFSVEWSGYIRVTESGTYRFQTDSDDGVRLYVDNQLLIERWNDHAVQTDTSAGVALSAGQVYPVRLQFYENGGLAEIRLRWQTPSSSGFVPIARGSTPSLGQGLYYCKVDRVAYYTIEHSGEGVTCEAEPITITAFDESDTPVEPPAGTVLDLATAPATGAWVGGSPYVFDGNESQILLYLQQSTPAVLNINVSDGQASEAPDADPDLNFKDTGIRFYANSATTDPIPNQVAGELDPDPVLRVVERDTDTGTCEARVQNQTLEVDLAHECRNPINCVSGQTLILAETATAANSAGSVANYTSVDLNFDNQGFAAVPLAYSDVGQVRLHARLALPASGEDPAVTVTGSSDEFVVRPYTLVASRIERLDGTPNPRTTSGSPGFLAAGEAFRVVVESRNASGVVTPNFGNESPRQSPRLTLEQLVYPASGNPGALANTEAMSIVGANTGSFENTSVFWNEAGSFTLTPRLVGDSYLASGDIASYSESETVGRFYPQNYFVTASSSDNSCGGYTYMDEPTISLSYTLEARGQDVGVLSNYDDGFGYTGTAVVDYTAENDDDGNDLSSRISAGTEPWVGGVKTVSITDALFTRGPSVEAPLSLLQLGLALNDPLDGRPFADPDINPGTMGDCTASGNCSARAIGGLLNLRYGRLNLASAYGPESLDLPVPLATEYFNGVRWQTNSQDDCTQIARAAVDYPAGRIDEDANRSVTIGAGSTRGEYPGHIDSDNLNFIGGEIDHYFSAPGAGNTGQFDVTIDLIDYPWLQFDWEAGSDTSVSGTYRFGSYRGHDRIIYWREVLD